MKIRSDLQEKTDEGLRAALQAAEEHEVLRTLMLLETDDDEEAPLEPHPQDYPSRQAYRAALISQKADQAQMRQRTIREALVARSLELRGGAFGNALIVEGTARDIVASLELPGVKHASLDAIFEPPSPEEGDE